MPKDTYTNLPDWKRQKIFETALEEFSIYGYEKASISRIVEHAGIAKGSFYQYFEGKEDLFRLIFTTAGELKLEYLNQLGLQSGNLGFFDLLRVLYQGALVFTRNHPKLSSVTDRFMKSDMAALKESILGDAVSQSNRFLEQLLQLAIAKGEVDPTIHIPLTAHLLTSLSLAMGDYMRSQVAELRDIDEESYCMVADHTLRLLERGIGNPAP